LNAEQLAQRLLECRLLEPDQIDAAFSALGGRDASFDRFRSFLIQSEMLTNWQTQRVDRGHRKGFFYGDWKVLYLVGEGTFARVYRAAHRTTKDVKAVKVLRNRYSNDKETQERFMREARTVMKLRHPNIVPIHEVGVDHHRTYMVMDFIEGQNLREYVRVHGRVRLPVALSIMRDLAAGLEYASLRGVTHRDLKLSNVLLSSTGRANLVDFGLAVVDKSEDDAPGFNPRSVDYAGLEKLTNVPRDDKRSDMFFLGCVMYYMLAGRPPLFETKERMRRMSAERFREIPPITNFVDLPHRVVILLKRLMEIDPERRVQSPTQAVREIDEVIAAVKAGDLKQYSESLSREEAEEFARRTKKYTEGVGHTIMLIESRQDVQDQLRERLKKRGYRVLIVGDPRRALERFEGLDVNEPDPADCVIFSCAGLGQANLEAFNFFAQQARTSAVPAILLIEQNQAHFLATAALNENRVSVTMPIRFREIQDCLRQLLRIEISEEEPE
jgi:tRNA A-37 threonylcarbamoyl transferase component Bud32/CheY-like chemotaxis protein